MRYKLLIQKRVSRLKKLNPRFRYTHLAQKLGIEPSYLSRFFTDANVHFSDELLFSTLRELKMGDSEIEEIMILKELDRSARPDRKAYLEQRLKLVRVNEIRQEIGGIRDELAGIVEFLRSSAL